MVGVQRSETDDGTVFVIEAPTLLMSLRELQSFFTPDAFDLLVVDGPTLDTQKRSNLAIPISTILLGQPDQG